MPCIKVGLSEWIVVNSKNPRPFVLWTNYLLDCVAVTIITPERAFMTHIFSEISVDEWEKKFKDEFLRAIKQVGDLKEAMCWITVSREEENKSKLHTAVEKTLENVWGENDTQFGIYSNYDCPAVRVVFNPDSRLPRKFGCKSLDDNRFNDEWGELMDSETGKEYIEVRGLFSTKGADKAQIIPDKSKYDDNSSDENDVKSSDD